MTKDLRAPKKDDMMADNDDFEMEEAAHGMQEHEVNNPIPGVTGTEEAGATAMERVGGLEAGDILRDLKNTFMRSAHSINTGTEFYGQGKLPNGADIDLSTTQLHF